MLRDTKNRSDHKLLLSRQALEIVERNRLGKEPDDPLFAIVVARKTLAWINAVAGITVQGHGLRATFASTAEELVSGGALKRMLNHAAGGDVTLGHYVGKSETQLRVAWQTVADFIDDAAAKEAAPVTATLVLSKGRARRSVTRSELAKTQRASPRSPGQSVTRPLPSPISERV